MSEGHNQGEDNKGDDIDVAIEVQQNILDDLVNANSMFTIAVFIGLSVVNPGDTNLQGEKKCNADQDTYSKLIVHEVISFAFYLQSSLVAKALKTHLYTYSLGEMKINRLCSRFIRGFMLILPASGSILGSIFLSLSMVELIEIRLGKMSCRNTYTIQAADALINLVVIALSIYFIFMTHAIYTSVKKMKNGNPK